MALRSKTGVGERGKRGREQEREKERGREGGKNVREMSWKRKKLEREGRGGGRVERWPEGSANLFNCVYNYLENIAAALAGAKGI